MSKSAPKKSNPKSQTASKNKTVAIILIVCLILILVCAVAYVYLKGPATVSFDFNYDGAEVQTQRISFGKQVVFPTNCTRDGYTFAGWYSDKTCTVSAQTSFLNYFLDQTFYAKWIADNNDGGGNGGGDGGGSVVTSGALSIHFLELGNQYTGDCVYIKAGDTDILIDAGSRKNSATTICNYVNQYCTDGILEYVIVTHAHQDHIAGFVGTGGNGVFANFECKNIIQFALTNANTAIYRNYCEARNSEVAEGANLFTAQDCIDNANGAQKVYNLTSDGSIQMEILDQCYYREETDNENNYSVCMMITQGENHYLFTGDLEGDGEASLCELNPDLPQVVLYKGGHHGSYTAASEVLLKAIQPQYVCICCCTGSTEYTKKKNNHTFPAQEFIDRVAVYTDNVYVTTLGDTDNPNGYESMNGNIVFSCVDGVISLTFSGNDLKLKDTQWFKENRTTPKEWAEG